MGTVARLGLGAVGLALGVVAVLALREATLSTHEHVEPDSTTSIEVRAATRGGEHRQTLAEMVEALLHACRLEVSSDVVGAVRDHGDGHFSAVLQPALDPTNRRQMRGCVEDWTIDHLRVDVVELASSTP